MPAPKKVVVTITPEAYERLLSICKDKFASGPEALSEAVRALQVLIAEGRYCAHPGCFNASFRDTLRYGGSMRVADFALPYCSYHVPKPPPEE